MSGIGAGEAKQSRVQATGVIDVKGEWDVELPALLTAFGGRE